MLILPKVVPFDSRGTGATLDIVDISDHPGPYNEAD